MVGQEQPKREKAERRKGGAGRKQASFSHLLLFSFEQFQPAPARVRPNADL
jgi:hypothetical protein